MGNLISISISIEDSVSRCWNCAARQANYTIKLEQNLKALRDELQELTELRNDVKGRVDVAEEQQQLKQLNQVEGWLSRANAMITEVDQLIRNSSQQVKCFRGNKYGKRVANKLQEVIDLKSKGEFPVVAKRVPTAPVHERPVEPTVGLDSMLEKVWRVCLTDEEEVGIIGLYGMGGVGKTTLLTQINNKFLNTDNYFDVVIWVTVSKDFNLDKVQQDIEKKIGFSNESGKDEDQDPERIDGSKKKNKGPEENAIEIFKVLSKKKFVLLLDDIWERVDLTKIGVPIPNKMNRSKVVFTTRSEEVCGRMEAHSIKVQCLAPENAWDLFQKKVGQKALSIHPEIPELAKIVAEECSGLPLALITIGRAMACKKTPQEWRRAIEVLKKSASEFPGMDKEVYALLKFSYDNLPDHRIRSCLLYCALFPEDFSINKADLVDYWIGEGILDAYDDRSGAENEGYYIIGTLLDACLLDAEKDDFVKMHDVIRDMALWIACDLDKEKENFFVQAGVQLIKAPEVGKWEGARRVSFMANHIQNFVTVAPTGPHLLTFFLRGSSLRMVSSDLFEFMSSLQVLDLSKNRELTDLPWSISKLVSLQYLNLSETGIKELPIVLNNLVELKYLNFEHTTELHTIPSHLVSSFSKLRILRMIGCSSSHRVVEDSLVSGGYECLLEELQCLEELNVLTTSIITVSALQRFLSSNKFQTCSQGLALQFIRGTKSVDISFLTNLKNLEISDCESLEELKFDHEGANMQATSNLRNSVMISERCFYRLSMVDVFNCPRLVDLTWLVHAPNIMYLRVIRCSEMKEIICKRKLSEIPEVGGNLNLFARLEVLSLRGLPQITSIYCDALPFPCLKEIEVVKCPKLKKLPLNSNSAKEHEIVIKGKEDWWRELEWEDDATLNVFLPCFKPVQW